MSLHSAGLQKGLFPIGITSIEKRFGFESWMTGLLFTTYDIGFILSSLFVTYNLRNMGVPRIIAWALVLFSIGSLLFALPHFLTDLYQYTNTDREGNLSSRKWCSCSYSSDFLELPWITEVKQLSLLRWWTDLWRSRIREPKCLACLVYICSIYSRLRFRKIFQPYSKENKNEFAKRCWINWKWHFILLVFLSSKIQLQLEKAQYYLVW